MAANYKFCKQLNILVAKVVGLARLAVQVGQGLEQVAPAALSGTTWESPTLIFTPTLGGGKIKEPSKIKKNILSKAIFIFAIFLSQTTFAQTLKTPFEISNQQQTTTYAACIKFYETLAKKYANIKIINLGVTDANLPLPLIIYSQNKNFNPASWQQNKQPILFINNGIHPGEPDGIDATMVYLRDVCEGKIKAPKNMVIAIIPIYNIGGALQRNNTTRVNQNGPVYYGFRGNSQNLDLNRDFIKADSREALLFANAFHYINPDIFLDTHVSDGADYQHILTLLTTHHNKLLPQTNTLLHNTLEPAIYKKMLNDNYAIIPYVNFEDSNPEKGWAAFYDAPRYSTGYTALFNCIGFMSETHMLKPFNQRVQSTYTLIKNLAILTSTFKPQIRVAKTQDLLTLKTLKTLPLKFNIDSSRVDSFNFNGYAAETKISDVTGQPRLYYNRNKPFSIQIPFYNYLKVKSNFEVPTAYIISQGWHKVIARLTANNVAMQMLKKDTLIAANYFTITNYKSSLTPYENHHRNTQTELAKSTTTLLPFKQGDYIIYTNQPAKKFLHAVLSPQAEDSYFTWNFFDAILQQKEGYSNYRWEDIAAQILIDNPNLKTTLETKKRTDKNFAADANAQLEFVYKNSIWYEPNHNRYPVYFLE